MLKSKSDYLSAKRVGRGTEDRVLAKDREVIWEIYSKYEQELKNSDRIDFDDYAIKCLQKIENDPSWKPPFTHIIIDEAQDLNKAQVLVLTKLVPQKSQNITIIQDIAQKIVKRGGGFTWSEIGLDMRGKTYELKKNYRNTGAIARVANSLLENEKDKSEFTEMQPAYLGGEKPKVGYFENQYDQYDYLKKELSRLKNQGSTVVLHKHKAKGVNCIEKYLLENGFKTEVINYRNKPVNFNDDSIKICTMASIKGLEFDNVFITGLADDIIPHSRGLVEPDEELHISTERKLLYTCITRAKKRLYLLGTKHNPSRFLSEIDADLLDKIILF